MGFKSRVIRVIGQADLLVEVLDSRFPEQTRNKEIEKMISGKGKKLLLVLNKSDLVSDEKIDELKRKLSKKFPCIYVSTKSRTGSLKLREMIGKLTGGKQVKVGIIGYPNTGKSSLVNYLKGKKAAKTSITSGFTKGEQFVNISEQIKLIDTPGVIPTHEWDEFRLVLVSSKNANQIKDPEYVGEQLVQFIMNEDPEALAAAYDIKPTGTAAEVLEEIAFKKKKLKKGGKPNLEVVSKQIIMDWQKGKLKIR